MKLFLTILVLTAALVAGAQPAQIILLRHAEKPADPANVHLAPRGEQRARALVTLLGRNSPFTTNAPVVALYAAGVTSHGHSHRTGETLAPLSKDLGLSVHAAFDSDHYKLVADEILHQRAYRGKSVIICWTHHDIADLAAALGVKPKPAPWKEKIFDRLWLIDYSAPRPRLREVPQRLLKGDSAA